MRTDCNECGRTIRHEETLILAFGYVMCEQCGTPAVESVKTLWGEFLIGDCRQGTQMTGDTNGK